MVEQPRETTHAVCAGDARALPLSDDSVDLVVTSPPYPMIEQWDDLFAALDPAVGDSLDAGEGREAFERMHAALDAAWDEVARVLVDGGIACVNVGDATRSVGGRFRLYPNHTRVSEAFRERGFDQLPGVLWRKPTNSPTKFMGSGTLPPNAYVTLEHEHVLVFRNGSRRSFPPRDDDRYEAAYLWEERNRWFSESWTDLRGAGQELDDGPRERSAAYPVELPYRLVNMYSVYGDRVLDPFWGTGTTTLAAMLAARDSVGVERDRAFVGAFPDRLAGLPVRSVERGRRRLDAHRSFLADRSEPPGYDADHYDFRVVTRNERSFRLYAARDVDPVAGGYRVTHDPLEGEP
ncbi:DNA-methyltransferase [Candidatus Halobonum tyrrellensis]|uniref:Type II methyltransferase n=1 Tax=Candidatus Halobonum tyrrellensis G22 TaxID=1324957 RepID=V4HLU0_9EURY|nr:site-specific DNA-methyltransferase [Candidatus Halobonum tyrrellensis]ESP88874.1 CTAG modification methylase / site-specific DNA-methyltransferase (cytosine-N4-specific) [Candidatus Halobonum tyrrellensis G22]